jgi:hypothetical protein
MVGRAGQKTISFLSRQAWCPVNGASALDIVVSQTIKNLGRINLAADEIATKLPKWTIAYGNVIRRVVRDDAAVIRHFSQASWSGV